MRVRALATLLACSLASALALVTTPSVTSAPAAAADAPAPFTLAVLPDTQLYTTTDDLAATARAQTQWVVDHRSDLNIDFTVQLGDLVDSWPNTAQWDRISTAFATLDQNNVPYAVVPGNHDLDYATGQATTYRQYFPVSRFRDAAWNNATTQFGGYLGSNTFGTDPVDRGTMDTFDLLTAGGVKWLVLNLEFEAPDYVLDWAQKVLDAYPDRRVIMVTHNNLDYRGWRTNELYRSDAGINSSNAVWNKFVYHNCTIDFVLSGHQYLGDQGEASRTDPDACGKPVVQLLTDYQGRPNGGDGWLRYYTFDPAHDTVNAFTYSVTKQVFETDADSQFSIPYDFSPDPTVTDDVVVPGGSTWKYRNETGAWPGGWDGTTYDDSGWSSGTAPLGFNAGMVVTDIDRGPPTSNRATSMLFRRTFDVPKLDQMTHFRLITKADDGIVVRVNGQEVGRTNMPTGTVGATTNATAAPRSMAAQQVVYDVPLSLLKPTGNVIAASVHLNYLGTTDAHFDLVALGTRPTTPTPPPTTENVTLVGDSASWAWRYSSDAWPAGWTAPGFADGSWSQGAAPLGFGTTVATDIDVPPPTTNRPRTALFRRTFQIDDPTKYSSLQLTSRADDGVVLTVNGTEVNRTRMPAGTLSTTTYATAAPSTAAALASPVTVSIPSSLLRAGTNVIAAATALNYRGTPNASFAAKLTAVHALPSSTSPPSMPSLHVDSTTTTSAALSWSSSAGDTVTGWTLLRDGASIATLPAGQTTYTDTSLSPATSYAYSLTASNANGDSPPATANATTASTSQPVTLVAAGSSWHYLYPATWPSGWSATSFDDSGWSAGAAPLGFGSSDIATNVDVPPPTSNRPRSVLLRRTITIPDHTKLSALQLTTRADDGVVVYVDGQEVGRSNVAPGSVGAATYATAAPRTSKAVANPVQWSVPASMLQDGANTIAVAELLNYRATPDLSFDLTLAGQQTG
jgi:hypothetical protein